MTQPNELTPPDGINDTGLADFATKTQFDWQSLQRTGMLARFLPAQLGFFGIFDAVAVAQKSANFANITNVITKATTLASGVASGVSINDPFSGAAADDLGASWTRTSSGAGAGHYGPLGAGTAGWKISGTSTRTHSDVHNTVVFTDFQAAMVVVTAYPQYGGARQNTQPYTYLTLRSNSAGTEFVYCRIGNKELAIGKCVAGVIDDPWVTVNTVNVGGDTLTFLAGTNANQRDFLVIQNGFTQINHTDTTSSTFGASNRYVGLINACGRDPGRRGNAVQLGTAQLDVWAACDRQASTT